MNTILKVTTILCVSSLILAGCQTTGGNNAGAVLQPNATPLTTSEMYTHFAEKTQARDTGSFYYTELGTLVSLKDGERIEGTWGSYDGGKLCRHFDDQGTKACEIYYNNGSVISMETEGVISLEPKLYKGDQLEYLETGSVKKIFTKDETIALVSGKTHAWEDKNGAYYSPDGKLITIWDGQKESGKWSVNDKGALCWHIPSWGKSPCESYFMGPEGLMAIYKGQEDKAAELKEGNVLDSL